MALYRAQIDVTPRPPVHPDLIQSEVVLAVNDQTVVADTDVAVDKGGKVTVRLVYSAPTDVAALEIARTARGGAYGAEIAWVSTGYGPTFRRIPLPLIDVRLQ